MILGKGNAQTEAEIIQEYQEFIIQQGYSSDNNVAFSKTPSMMRDQIGKPLTDWEDDDILEIIGNGTVYTKYKFIGYLAFLFFYGYKKASIYLLSKLPTYIALRHRKSLNPMRLLVEETNKELKYANQSDVGAEFTILIWLLAVMGKPREEITRRDFEGFREEYQEWYLRSGKSKIRKLHPSVARVERFFIHWGILQPVRKIIKHEEYLCDLKHDQIRDAILDYINWYEAKSSPTSVCARRKGLTKFFLWLQDAHPNYDKLDDVNRDAALAYAHHINELVETKRYSPRYRNDQYRHIRLFYDFVVFERSGTPPDRNPFSKMDMIPEPDPLPRYIPDHELRKVLDYCYNGATLKEKTVVAVLLHTGIRAFELVKLCTTDIVQIQGVWKLHIREGKGLKDRLIPLTSTCHEILQEWLEYGWEGINEHLFTRHGTPWRNGTNVSNVIRRMNKKAGVKGITAHRYRHTFAVALLNHGLRESALQKLLGHDTLVMTLEYGRILDKTVEMDFNQAVEKMKSGPISCVPSFFKPEEYEPFEEADAINWIRLPHGYCRRHPKMHCEADVKCLLCDRYCAHSEDLECLEEMYGRYLKLNMEVQADVVFTHMKQLEDYSESKVQMLPNELIAVP